MLQSKFWQAFFALAPFIIFLLIFFGYAIFMIAMFSQASELETDPDQMPFYFLGGLGSFLMLIFLAITLSLASLIFYIVHAVQNPNLKENNLLLVWILLFVFINGIAQFLYWIIEIINKRDDQSVISQ